MYLINDQLKISAPILKTYLDYHQIKQRAVFAEAFQTSASPIKIKFLWTPLSLSLHETLFNISQNDMCTEETCQMSNSQMS